MHGCYSLRYAVKQSQYGEDHASGLDETLEFRTFGRSLFLKSYRLGILPGLHQFQP